jgi:hypothetical protein
MAKSNFPGPYINTTTEDDPMMKRRPPDHMEIGARAGTLKSTLERSTLMGIKHTGDQNTK